ncbi:TlpA family protein disulfide reductase [Pelosinus propionicus]|uniref:Thiol-disulfide isomerase or thioredoxin n=1 Tax=Pelosinus propionicus DSM 13327 TaxID=1123291 RepID=A0A1I4GNW0_9FIRM|nr:TlpA disulfide reductase family protein [Pelosinus propionicus]SFL31173.1 Thiol-disulfide isomerase or thioredoxin [Pelosinus propionicus DSM 13327]
MMRRKVFITLLVVLLAFLGVWYIGSSKKESTPHPPDEKIDVKVGKNLPSFTLDSLAGNQVTVGNTGRITVINFWATWCPPCLEEMPELEKFAKKNQQKVQFYAVNLQESQEKVSDFMNRYNYTMPVLLDKDGIVAKQFQITAIPTTIIVDKNGLIKHRQSGAMTMNQLDGIINSL